MPAAKKKAPVKAAPAPRKAAKKTQAAAPAVEARKKKPKLVRDSFTLPKDERALLADLKARAAKLGRPAKKSEVLRAGVLALAAMGDAAFLASVSSVPAVKRGKSPKS